jgi:hypothetical protein
VFRALRTPDRAAALGEEVGVAVTRVLDGADLAVTLRRTRAEHLAALRAGLPAVGLRDADLLYVPELFQRSHGVRATRQIAEALGAELGY